MTEDLERPRASVLVVGDEILDGFLADANLPFLAQRLRAAGIDLDHAEILRDEIIDIAQALLRALSRPRPRIVLTTGGIGGTADDVTFEAVAQALGREVETIPALADPIHEIIDWAAEQGFEFDDDAVTAMLRIATVPEGADILQSETYLACVRLVVEGGAQDPDGATIVVLPGPPGHLQAIVDRIVAPEILSGLAEPPVVVEVEHDYPETVIVGALARLRQDFPDVRLGSYPGDTMVVRLQGGDAARVEQAAQQLRGELAALDRHPAADVIRRAWRRQVVGWAGD